MVEECSSIGREQERHCCRTVMWPQVDVNQLASTNSLSDVGMCGAISQVTQENRSGTLTLVERSTIGVCGCSCLRKALAVRMSHMTNILSRVSLVCISLGPVGHLLGVDILVNAAMLLVVVLRRGPGIVATIGARNAARDLRMKVWRDGALEVRTVLIHRGRAGSGR